MTKFAGVWLLALALLVLIFGTTLLYALADTGVI